MPAVPPPCGGNVGAGTTAQRKTAGTPRMPVVPSPCGGNVGAGTTAQRKTAGTPRMPVVPSPCGGNVGAGATAQRKTTGTPRMPAPRAPRSIVQRLLNYDLEDNSELNKGLMTKMDQVVQDIHDVLTAVNIAYAVQGSMAQAMHGAGLIAIPGDVDILVPSPKTAALAALKSGKFSDAGAGLLVAKVKHIATQVVVDLVANEDFGMSKAGVTTIDGKNVLNIYETLLSLLLRPEKRKKDHVAFISLLVPKADQLNELQKKNLANAARMAWEKLYGMALEEYKKFVMG
jgi:hypothetical protein